TGTVDSIPWLVYDGRQIRGYNAFTDNSGLPAIAVQAGFTKVVYDRTTRGSTEDLALSPPSVKRDVMLPFTIGFLGRPWSEPTLLTIASGYERARGPRTPPPDFSVDPPAVSGPPNPLCQIFHCRQSITNPGSTGSTSPATSGSADGASKQSSALTSEAALPAPKLLRSGRVFAEVRGAINTGIAINNPHDSAATVLFSMSDATGAGASGVLTVPVHGQIAKFLDQEHYNAPAGFQGTFAISSDLPVALTGLRGFTNEHSDCLSARLPI